MVNGGPGGKWDRVMDDTDGRKSLLAASGLERGRVLDIGMGDCACMSFFLARRGFDVVGIDRSSHAVHIARREAAGKRFKGHFEAKRADARRLPFQDGQFDATLAYHTLHHVDGLERAVAEMARVCRPGGLILIAEFHQEGAEAYRHRLNSDALHARIEGALQRRARLVRKARTRLNVICVFRKH